MHQAVITVDLHGSNKYQAKIALDSALRKAAGAYRIRVIHGYHSGNALRDFVLEEYQSHPKVLRMERGANPGQTELVLRERT